MRHTLAQQMKNGGMTNEEIADAFGWRMPAIIGTLLQDFGKEEKRTWFIVQAGKPEPFRVWNMSGCSKVIF